jgi:dipeptidase E
MKLFLSSLAISDSQAVELGKLAGKDPANLRLGLIENAADTYGSPSPDWLLQNRDAIMSHNFDVEIIDLRKYKSQKSELFELLSKQDVIWCGGGNEFYLRWVLNDTGADDMIHKLVRQGVIYGGGSAGAIMAGPTLKHFEAADDPNEAPEAIFDGLGLTKLVVVPHFDSPKFAKIIKTINQRLKDDGFETVPLGDDQALVIDGEEEKVV